MRRAACVWLAVLGTSSVVGSAAGAAGKGWHVLPVRRLGIRIGSPQAAAVNRFGTSVVVFASVRSHTLTVVRRNVHASKFKIAGRISANAPRDCPSCVIYDFEALANGRFLLVYTTGQRLLARSLDRAGRLRGRPHVLATGSSTTVLSTIPLVAVDSDASRVVVVWGVNNDRGTTVRVEGAIDDQAGWSSPKVFYSVSSLPPTEGPFFVHLVSDSQDRYLVSVHGSNGDPTAVLWGLPGGSRQWERVTPPEAADASTPHSWASYYGATLASVNGTITAAWQGESGDLVLSTWDGSTWTTPVTAVAGSKDVNGHPTLVRPVFVSDGSRAALVWTDYSNGQLGPIKAKIRASSGGSWSTPLTLPHSRGSYWDDSLSTIDTFWFTASGDLAGVWEGDPIKGNRRDGWHVAGLYVGRVGVGGASWTVLSRTETPNKGRGWFALRRGGGLTTIVWADEKGRELSATATRNGTVRHTRPLPACGYPRPAASNVEASPQVVAVTSNGPIGGNGTKCPSLLLW